MKLNRALLGGSAVLVITFGIFNVLNYFFHLGMLRMLTVAEYGVLATLLAIMYVIGIFTESVQTVLAKYAAAEQDVGKAKNLFLRSMRKAMIIATILFVVFLLVAIPFAPLLKIPYSLMALTGVIIFAMFLSAVGRGILQGRKMFRALGNTMMFEGVVKLVAGLALVFIGWKVYGAVAGALISVICAFLYSLWIVRSVLRAREKHVSTPTIYQYSWPVFIVVCTLMVFYNLDIFIAKIVFDEVTAGLYAITAVIAKTILFATQPISRAMFPLTASAKEHQRQGNVFRSALTILLACIAVALFFFYFFPDFIIWIFTGKALPEVSLVIIYAALATSLLALTNLVIFYRLSQGRIRNAPIFLLFIVAEAILLYTFSDNLLQFVLALMTSAAIFLWGSVVLLRKYSNGLK